MVSVVSDQVPSITVSPVRFPSPFLVGGWLQFYTRRRREVTECRPLPRTVSVSPGFQVFFLTLYFVLSRLSGLKELKAWPFATELHEIWTRAFVYSCWQTDRKQIEMRHKSEKQHPFHNWASTTFVQSCHPVKTVCVADVLKPEGIIFLAGFINVTKNAAGKK